MLLKNYLLIMEDLFIKKLNYFFAGERDTDMEIKELLTQMSKQKDNSIDLEITKMSVVYINNESNVDAVNEEKMRSQTQRRPNLMMIQLML